LAPDEQIPGAFEKLAPPGADLARMNLEEGGGLSGGLDVFERFERDFRLELRRMFSAFGYRGL